MRLVLATLSMWVFGCLCARAEELVVLRERAGLRPGLCAALRIQLSDLGEVTCEPDLVETALDVRLRQTSARVGELGARVGVLMERDPDPTQVRMFLVTSQGEQAVIAFERIEDRKDPDVDRSLALKVRSAVELVPVIREAAPVTPVESVGLIAPVPARVHERVPVRGLFLDTGAALTILPNFFGQALLGLFQRTDSLRLEAAVGARFHAAASDASIQGRVQVRERAALLSLRALRPFGRFAVGGAVDLSLAFLSAEGTARDGSRGSALRVGPRAALALDLRVTLLAHLALRFAPSLELAARVERFQVDRRDVFEGSRVRAILPLSLVLETP